MPPAEPVITLPTWLSRISAPCPMPSPSPRRHVGRIQRKQSRSRCRWPRSAPANRPRYPGHRCQSPLPPQSCRQSSPSPSPDRPARCRRPPRCPQAASRPEPACPPSRFATTAFGPSSSIWNTPLRRRSDRRRSPRRRRPPTNGTHQELASTPPSPAASASEVSSSLPCRRARCCSTARTSPHPSPGRCLIVK